MGKSSTLVLIVIVFLMGCTSSKKRLSKIPNPDWLVGTWENKTPRGSIYETWKKDNATQYSGKSYMVRDKDTAIFETIQLLKEADVFYYVPVVKNQNQGEPVRFRAKTISDTDMVFENPEHDFPQRISYTKVTLDSLVAEISGVVNGQERKQQFPMRRKN